MLTIVILRLLASRHPALAIALFGCAVPIGGCLVAIAIARRRRARARRSRWADDGRLFAALVLHLVVAGVAAAALVGALVHGAG
ncbi:hypothetical protein SKPI104516_07000 [Skermania piniformis]